MGYKKIISGLFLAVFLMMLIATSALAINPSLDWKTLETDHFRIHFHDGEKTLALKSASIAETAHEEITQLLNWVPRNKTELILSDEMDFSNGAATPVPFNSTYIFVTPPNEPNSLEDFDDWLRVIIKHEYTHIVHLDKASGFPRGIRKAFGRMVLFFPNLLQPNWIIEGLATHIETDEEVGEGRGQSSHFAMMMRTEVDNGVKPVSQVNLPNRSWPGGTSYYLYGVYFFQFIEDRYGEEAVIEYVESNSNNVIPFRVNANTHQIFGKNMTDLWAEFTEYMEDRFNPEIQAIRASGVVEGEALTSLGYRSGTPVAMSDGSAFFVEDDGFTRPALMRQTGNEVEHITDVHFAARLDMHEQAGALISQPEICDNNYVYFDLFKVSNESHSIQRLTHCARYVYSSWSPAADEIIAVKMELGQSSLHRLNADGELLEILWEGRQDEVISQIDWSPDGSQVVASVWRSGNWNLELFDLETNTWIQLTNDHWVQLQPRFSEDGQSVVYSADYDKVYNIHKLTLSTGQVLQLTNVTGGAFSPSIKKGVLYYRGYGAKGYDIYRLDQPLNITRDQQSQLTQASDNTHIEIGNIKLTETDYSAWSSLRPRWWFPSAAAATGEGFWLGAVSGGNDALRAHSYLMSAAVEVNTGTFSTTFSYLYNNRFLVALERGADVDMDGEDNDEVVSIRIENEFQLLYDFPLYRVNYDWHFLLNATLDEEYTDEIREGVTPLPDSNDGLLGLGLLFNNSRNFNYSISKNDGRTVKLIAETSDALESDFSGNIYVVDWREYIQIASEHVLAIRLVNGWGTEQPKPFELGGVNALSSDLSIFNKREYNLRGYDENIAELTGRRMQLASAEWRFPLARIERGWMSPPLGLSQLAGNVFYEAGASWNEGSSAEKFYAGAGIELSADLNLFYGYGLKVRTGFAHGFDEELGDDIFYLSVGSSF